jgi:hypothetical protein
MRLPIFNDGMEEKWPLAGAFSLFLSSPNDYSTAKTKKRYVQFFVGIP